MGRGAAMVEREGRNIRAFISRSGAVAGCSRESAAPEGHGTCDDVFHSAQFLLFRGRVRRIMAGLDLVQHRSRYSEAEAPGGPTNVRGGCRFLDNRARAHAELFANGGTARSKTGGAFLL